MSVPFHTTVHMHGIKNEMFNRSMAFAIPAGLTKKDVEGRALAVDPTGPCRAKLAADGDTIIARLDIYEDRGLVTAQFRWSDLMPIAAGDLVAVGDTVVGAGSGVTAGFVKKAPANNPHTNWVAEILTIKGQKYAAVVRL